MTERAKSWKKMFAGWGSVKDGFAELTYIWVDPTTNIGIPYYAEHGVGRQVDLRNHGAGWWSWCPRDVAYWEYERGG